jgi:hypothetical protein
MTALKSVPLEELLQDVLNGVSIVDGLRLEDIQPQQIALVMIRVQAMRRAKVDELRQLTEAMGAAKKNATLAHTAAYLAYPGTPSERTQAGKQAAAEAEFAVDVAEGEVKACMKALEILQDDWDTCRSIGANQRAQRNAAEGYGG